MCLPCLLRVRIATSQRCVTIVAGGTVNLFVCVCAYILILSGCAASQPLVVPSSLVPANRAVVSPSNRSFVVEFDQKVSC